MSKIIENYKFDNEPISFTEEKSFNNNEINKEMCHKLIESTHNYKFELNCSDLLDKNSILPMLVIDLKEYDLNNKSIKNCCLSIKSKIVNGKEVIPENIIKKYLCGSIYELNIGFKNDGIYNDNFVNGQDIIISDIIIIMSCLTSHKTEIKLKNINKLVDILDLLILQVDITYVNFYKFFENLLEYSKIQKSYIDLEHSDIKTYIESEYKLRKKDFKIEMINMNFTHYNLYNLYSIFVYSKFGSVTYNINNKYQKKDTKNIQIENLDSEIIKLDNYNGIKLNNYNDIFFSNNNLDNIKEKYDFITWNNTFEIPVSNLFYYKLIKSNLNIHCYKIKISGEYNSLTNLSINIPDINFKDKNISFEFVDYYLKIINLKDFPININTDNSSININLIDDNQLFTQKAVKYLVIKIKNNENNEPIKNSIKLSGNFYLWNKLLINKCTHNWSLTNKNYYYIKPSQLNAEINKNVNFDKIPNFNKINLDILNKSIKLTHYYKFEINCSKILKLNFAEPMLVINLHDYGLSDKSINSCYINIKSKIIDGKLAIPDDMLKKLLYGFVYELNSNDDTIFTDNFTNGQNIFLSNIIFIMNCLKYNRIKFVLKNIYKIVDFINLIEIEVNINHVKFNEELETNLKTKNYKYIEQEYNYNNNYNVYRIFDEMGCLGYSNGLTKEQYNARYNPNKIDYNNIDKIKEIEKSKGESIKLNNLDGFKLNKYNDEFILDGDCNYLNNKYDFITWKNQIDIPLEKIIYYRIIEEFNYVHCYKINISGYYDSIINVSFNIPEINFLSYNKEDICFEFVDYNNNIVNIEKLPISITINNSIININLLNNNLLLTFNGIRYFQIKIKNKNMEKQIKNSIKMEANFYMFKTSYIKKYIYCNDESIYYYVNPLCFTKLEN